MKEKTLSRLVYVFVIVGIASYLVAHSRVFDNESEYMAKYAFMIAFGAVPTLLWLKAVSSSFFLEGLSSSSSTQNLETIFMLFYPVLTREARIKWKNKIDAKKEILDQNRSK